MAGSMSDVYEKRVLDLIFRNTNASATVPLGLDATNVWIGLGTAGSDSAFTELASSGAYARVAVVRTGAGFPAASGAAAQTSNTATITFPTATADWNSAANITHFAIFDAATSGNVVYWATLTQAKPVFNGDTMSFAVGVLVVTQD